MTIFCLTNKILKSVSFYQETGNELKLFLSCCLQCWCITGCAAQSKNIDQTLIQSHVMSCLYRYYLHTIQSCHVMSVQILFTHYLVMSVQILFTKYLVMSCHVCIDTIHTLFCRGISVQLLSTLCLYRYHLHTIKSCHVCRYILINYLVKSCLYLNTYHLHTMKSCRVYIDTIYTISSHFM